MQWFGRSNSVAVGLVAVGLVSAGLIEAASGKLAGGIGLLAGGLVILLPLLLGRGVGSWDDAMLLFNLVRNPGRTLYDQADAAFDRQAAKSARNKAKDVAAGIDYPEPPRDESFDADAAFARYMAKRPAPAPDLRPAPRAASFGRKPS
jgi:hypothetical protein